MNRSRSSVSGETPNPNSINEGGEIEMKYKTDKYRKIK